MLSYVTGNLFEAPVQTLVNTVNTQGVMGKGIALTFRKLYPEMFAQYQQLCEHGGFKTGSLFLYKTPTRLILNFPTKREWRKPARLEYIEAGLQKFVEVFNSAGIHSIAFPPLGCGNGELDFADVRLLMERYLSDLPIRTFIYAPHPLSSAPEHRTPKQMKQWLNSAPQDMPFVEFWADLHDLLEERTEFRTGRDTVMSAQFEKPDDHIRIRMPSKSVVFKREELEELWCDLRSHLVLPARAAIGNRERDISYLVPVLAELPYVQRLEIADDFDKFSYSPNQGIQLVPAERRATRVKQLEFV
jgi:O-acetyl-ADP-ribose deacetylase (regulator of RNase III)